MWRNSCKLLPAVGAAFDGINTAWYAEEGDWENALLSGLAFVPGIGEAVGAGKTSVKIGGKIIGHMDEAADIAKAADKAGNVAEAAGKAGKTGKRAGKFGKYADEEYLKFVFGNMMKWLKICPIVL